MDDWVWNLILFGGYVAYQVFAKKKEVDGEAPQADAGKELGRVNELVALADSVAEPLATRPGWKTVGPIYDRVVMPKLMQLRGMATQALTTGDDADVWRVAQRRKRLGWLITQLSQRAVEDDWGRANTWVGLTLYSSLDEVSLEVQTHFPVYPDPDVVVGGEMSRDKLQHLYAAWASVIWGDLATAILDPESARVVLSEIEASPRAHRGGPGEAPDYLRARILSHVLELPFRLSLPEGELVLQTTTGGLYALPVGPVVDDVLHHVGKMQKRRYRSLGGKTLEMIRSPEKPETVGQPRPVVVAAPQPTLNLVPAGKQAKEAKAAKKAKAARPAKVATVTAAPNSAPAPAAAAAAQGRARRGASSGPRGKRARVAMAARHSLRPRSRREVREAILLSEMLRM